MKKIYKVVLALGVSTLPSLGQLRGGFNTNSLAANDDGSTGSIPLGFNINFFGVESNSAFLNNNGNITFDAPLATFTPSQTSLPTSQIIAPFFGDVDTRGAGSALMTYSTGTLFGRNAFGVTWDGVGYFSSGVDKLNRFQLILVDRSDLSPGDFDFEFNYAGIEWETGGASGGIDGLGGDSARVGFSNGSGSDFEEFEGSSDPGAFLDGGPNALVELTNVNRAGRFLTVVRNGEITGIIPVTDESVATTRDSTSLLVNNMTRDLNGRLFRARSGRADEGDLFDSKKLEVFGSYDSFTHTIDRRSVSNAGGLLSTIVPESELNAETASAGLEYLVTKNFTLGGAALFSDGDVSHEDGSFDADIEAQGVAAYASLYLENVGHNTDLYFDVMVANIKGDLNTKRLILQDYDLFSSGDTEFSSFEGQVNMGAIFGAGSIQHGPFGQLKIVDGSIDAYTETGSAFAGSKSPEIDFRSTKLNVGYQITNNLNTSAGRFTPQIRVSYEQELEDQETTINTLSLAAPPESAIVLGAGIMYDAQGGMFAAVNYEYRHYDEGADSNSIGFRLGFEF